MEPDNDGSPDILYALNNFRERSIKSKQSIKSSSCRIIILVGEGRISKIIEELSSVSSYFLADLFVWTGQYLAEIPIRGMYLMFLWRKQLHLVTVSSIQHIKAINNTMYVSGFSCTPAPSISVISCFFLAFSTQKRSSVVKGLKRWIFINKTWQSKVFFQFEIIINAFSDSFEYLCYGFPAIRNMLIHTVQGPSVDIRIWRLQPSDSVD